MTSRLDRLFLLLETGSTPLTRKAAALQLGEVQKLHPHELNNLLVKVRQYLHSTSWETRIASSQAVEAIVSNVPYWSPAGIKEQPDEKCTTQATTIPGRMAFQNYDVNVVIRCGHNLMASEGKEYDQTDELNVAASCSLNACDDRERIFRQRQLLNRKLGLDWAEKLGMSVDFISNTDLLVDNDQAATAAAAAVAIKSETNELKLTEIIPQASGRSLKRKPSSQLQKTKSETDCDLKKIKTEPVEGETPNGTDAGADGGGIDWPLAWFADELMSDLFNAQWEIRHGAATGLREIVKLQGSCGGRMRLALAKDMDNLNQQWLEDLSLRLLSVLALDRFGDFLSDQVVAPVRETCAQVLGLTIKLLTTEGVNQVVSILLQLLQCQEWEARHGGMLGLKYLLAIRKDMIGTLLPTVFDPIFGGLKDSADDVSAVAAAALVPAKDALMNLMPEKVPLVIGFLWEALLMLDDLSSSTGDLLMLLSSLLTFKGLESQDQHLNYDDHQLSELIPRLWPFLFHSLSSVRKSVLDSLIILCEKSSNSWITVTLLGDALRLIYQRSLIESVNSILDYLTKVWHCLLVKATYETLIGATCNYLPGWIGLMMQPQKLAIDPANNPVWLDIDLVTKHRNSRPGHDVDLLAATMSEGYYIGGSETFGESAEEREKCIVRARYQCAKLIGALTFYLVEPVQAPNEAVVTAPGGIVATPQMTLESLANVLFYYLNSKSATQRMCTSWVIKEWALAKTKICGEITPLWLRAEGEPNKLDLYKPLADRCLEALSEPIYFEEMSSLFGRVQLHARDFMSFLRTNQVVFNDAPYAGLNVYTLVQINQLVDEIIGQSLPALKNDAANSKRVTKKTKALIDNLEEKVMFMKKSIGELSSQTNTMSIAVNSSIASAMIAWHYLPEKLNPVARPIMDSIKCEVNEQLQRSSATSLVQLLRLCCERSMLESPSPTVTPVPKIVKNLVVFLCSDRNFTPEVVESSDSTQLGIITLSNMQKISEKVLSFRRCNSTAKNRATEDNAAGGSSRAETAAAPSLNGSSGQPLDQATEKLFEIQRRGATLALCSACKYFAEHLPDRLPVLWEYINQLSHRSLPSTTEEGKVLVQHLQVLEVVGAHISSKLHPSLTALFDFLTSCLESSYIAVRHMAARCYGMLATILPNETMNIVLYRILDQLESPDAVVKRQGAVEAISCVIERLQLNIVPYIVLLIVPMLGRMSDQNESVRMLATQCFAQLIQLMPLDIDHHSRKTEDAGGDAATAAAQENVKPVANGCSTASLKEMLSSSKINFSDELLKRKESERHFLEQLVDISRLDNYELPIPVKAELRTYQQDGLNWLAFLNKYKLHGIIADEMGLGKTLQAICILASDHHYMLKRFKSGESKNPPLPSIVICPPTLTGHWIYEVNKFIDTKHLQPILYSGPPLERATLKNQIKSSLEWKRDATKRKQPRHYTLVIASYDLVRNDIDFFSAIRWNYCILDEGHVIKNGKTKLAKAIKSLPANHRLILTGTPIQNNVLELWSLFDFLMPGFLGTERQFMARYSRPILASRDAKSSSKEQEAGILAMEGLHRQVLPFILRRMKEDVLKDLPPKIIQDYYCELSPLQVQLYEDFSKSRARQSLQDAITKEAATGNEPKPSSARQGNPNYSHIFQSLQYLRKVCNHPKLVLVPSHPQYEKISDRLKAENTTLSDINHAAKLCALKQLLLDCGIGTQTSNASATEPVVNQHRVLVFCQLKSMLDIVEKDLLRAHMPTVTYLRLDGNVPPNDRHSVVHSFNNDPSIDILLLTTQVGGLGLNLTGADTVIFVEHDWNPMKDLQAMDRAHRIGQKKVVNIYRLITTGTLEEKIMGLQKFKLTVANTIISSENASLNSMGTDQLLDLFELSSSGGQDKDATTAGRNGDGNGVSMKAMLDNLPELWDVKQYENEYDLSSFLGSLSNSA